MVELLYNSSQVLTDFVLSRLKSRIQSHRRHSPARALRRYCNAIPGCAVTVGQTRHEVYGRSPLTKGIRK